MYTLVIGADRTDAPVEEWLRSRGEAAGDVMVVGRDSLAAQLLRSDAPPGLVVRIGAEGLELSPIVDAADEAGRDSPPLIVITDAEGEIVVRALSDCSVFALTPPLTRDRFLKAIAVAMTPDDGALGMSFEARSPLPDLHFGQFVGESAVMHRVYRALSKVARGETTCLVTGESGTGKELAAAVVHQLSERATQSFVAVNCGAIPENLLESEFFGHKKGAFTGAINDHKGRFQLADDGTLFLDEIGEMQLSLQVKLLRALQTGEITPVGQAVPSRVNVRVVAATNRDLAVEMQANRFREDLYYRLAVVPVRLPALRERREDIPLLIRWLVERINMRSGKPVKGITRRALDALVSWDWPGNVRELGSMLERMVVMSDESILTVDDLPSYIRSAVGMLDVEPLDAESVDPFASPALPEEGLNLADVVLAYENALIVQALERTGWNKNQAAQLLQMNRTTLVEKLKKRGLMTPDEMGDDS